VSRNCPHFLYVAFQGLLLSDLFLCVREFVLIMVRFFVGNSYFSACSFRGLGCVPPLLAFFSVIGSPLKRPSSGIPLKALTFPCGPLAFPLAGPYTTKNPPPFWWPHCLTTPPFWGVPIHPLVRLPMTPFPTFPTMCIVPSKPLSLCWSQQWLKTPSPPRPSEKQTLCLTRQPFATPFTFQSLFW